MNWFKRFFAAALCFCSLIGTAQVGNWQAYFLNVEFDESPWRVVFDAQHRDHNLFGDLDHIIVRPAVQYFHASTQSSYLAGYSFFLFQNPGDPNTSVLEHRLFQDVDLRQNLGRIVVRHRYRAEERFVENTPFSFRLRYAIFMDIPLNRKVIEAKTWYIPIWNEVFVNTDPIRLDRNWLYAGLGYQITDGFGIRAGAMNQFQTTTDKFQWVLSLHHNLRFQSNSDDS
ncbi:MAG: hypothetical protein Salg2KO_12450 [Salibacteraceae bacterium]